MNYLKKYLPHITVIIVIIFLSLDYLALKNQTSSPQSTQFKNDGSHKETNFMEENHKINGVSEILSQKKREKRMGVFHYNEGNQFYQEGNFSKAITQYEKALLHNKEFKEAIINLSTAYMKNKHFDKAFKILSEGQKMFPNEALIDYNFACYYSLIKDLGLGMTALKKAVQKGYKEFKQMKGDPDLANLRNSEKYRQWQATYLSKS